MFSNLLKRLSARIIPDSILRDLEKARIAAERAAIIAKEQYVAASLLDTRYSDPRRLERFGFKTYSQYDEDGIVQEIFRRIGTTNKKFIEFGVETGIENNTLKLLLQGWRGLWLEGNSDYVAAIEKRFFDVLESGQLSVRHSLVTAENINELIRSGAEGEIDLLSIDIDGNDYYVWKSLTVVKPRVIVIEYNGKFRPPLSIVQKYDATRIWSGTDYQGASLEALVHLGKKRGYSLVGCNFAGANAFFVRNDLVEEKFQPPFSAENHFQPARYFLWQLYVSGHPPDWGQYIHIDETS